MSDTTFTFRVDETLKTEFATTAKICDRSSAQLLRNYMRDFARQQEEAAAHDAWFRRQVQIGLDSANAGDNYPDRGGCQSIRNSVKLGRSPEPAN